jgi:hypothetical protein
VVALQHKNIMVEGRALSEEEQLRILNSGKYAAVDLYSTSATFQAVKVCFVCVSVVEYLIIPMIECYL